MRTRRRIIGLGFASLLSFTACASDRPAHPKSNALSHDRVTVGSYDFAESELLAELYGHALESRGYRVARAFKLGPREFVAPALAAGLVELVPDYAGTALQFASLGDEAPSSDSAETHRALTSAVRTLGLDALAPAPAQDANAFVVRRATAEEFGLRTLSDLAAFASRLVLGGPPECPSRPFCLRGLQERYGLRFKDFVALDVGGPLTRQALDSRAIDVALLFTTDPSITGTKYVELADDRRLQPAENITPLVRRTVTARLGAQFVAVIDGVSARLTTRALRDLNAQVGVTASVATVASRWLRSQGLA